MDRHDVQPMFSYPIHGDLDDEVNRAAEASMALRVVSDEAVKAARLADIGAAAVERYTNALPPEAAKWAEAGLDEACAGWQKYDIDGTLAAPAEILQSRRGKETLRRLFETKETLAESEEMTAIALWARVNVAETMNLALVPWQAFKDNLKDLRKWIGVLRDVQGVASDEDFLSFPLMTALLRGEKIYRNPNAKHAHGAEWLSVQEYLDDRIAHDGPWGVILAQTNSYPGVVSFAYKSPNDLTHSPERHTQIDGCNVDGLGIFEWLALTYQSDVSSFEKTSWLLANRILALDPSSEERSLVPNGSWSGKRVVTGVLTADYENCEARLAVL